jgi:hypothetical protein
MNLVKVEISQAKDITDKELEKLKLEEKIRDENK